MKPLKLLFVFALVWAAAVLIPLRRAQRVFAALSATSSVTSAPRTGLRRRPKALPVVQRDDGTRLTNPSKADTYPIPRRRLLESSSPHAARTHDRAVQSEQATTSERPHPPVAADDDAVIDAPSDRLEPEQLVQRALMVSRVAETQAIADVAAPPPKHA